MVQKIICSILLPLSIFFTATAQESTEKNSNEELITLEDAIDIALANNFDIEIQSYDQEIASNNNSWGVAGRLPNVSANINANNALSENIPAGPAFSQGLIQDNAVSGNLAANWTIFNGNKIIFNKNKLDLLEQQAGQDGFLAIENVINNIVRQYYLVLLEKENLKVLSEVMGLSRDRYERSLLQKDLGSGGSFEMLQQKSNYLADSVRWVDQRLAFNRAKRSLLEFMAVRDVNKKIALEGELPKETNVIDLETEYDKVLSHNNQLLKQEIVQNVLNYNIKIASADKVPKLDVSLGVQGRLNRQAGDIFNFSGGGFEYQDNTGYSYGPFLNFTLGIPIYTGQRNNINIENTKLQAIQGQVQLEKLQLELYRKLSDAVDLYNSRAEILAINTMSKEAAQTNLKLGQDRFQMGTITSFDFRQLQNQYLNAAISELRSMYNVVDAKLGLMILTGELIQTFDE